MVTDYRSSLASNPAAEALLCGVGHGAGSAKQGFGGEVLTHVICTSFMGEIK
jgi:hypothetical protein